MQGIAGTYGENDKRTTGRMLDKLMHRGPGRKTVHVDAKATVGGVVFGRRPAVAEEKGVAVAGDIALFNRDELAKRYLGEAPDEYTDDDLLLSMYLKSGPRMFRHLRGGFAVAVSDRGRVVLARDPYGLKPLYISRDKKAGAFSSEIKSQVLHGGDFIPFPPGKVFVAGKGFGPAGPAPHTARVRMHDSSTTSRRIREAVLEAVESIRGPEGSFNVLLSGGLDSSVVAASAAKVAGRLETACVGTDGSMDMPMASRVAEMIGSTHREKVYDVDEMLEVLDDVTYYSETFDMPLVRSCIPNLMATRMFEGSGRVTLCGEGGDEVFAGYDFLRDVRGDEALRRERIRLLKDGHITGFQRVDRMMAASSLDGRMPLMAPEVVALGLSLGRRHLIGPRPADSKLALKKAFKDMLPAAVISRRKRRFSDGAGSIHALAGIAEEMITDKDFEAERKALPKGRIRTKEELLYFRSFSKHFDSPSAVAAVGFTQRP